MGAIFAARDDHINGSTIGRFRHVVSSDTWEWDDEVFRVHGYEPGAVVPTTALVLASKHPDDRARVRALLDRVARTGESFSLSYRLVGGDGVVRRVLLVGEGGACDGVPADTIQGYYIDLTPDFDAENEEYAAAAIAEMAATRATVEQAKGIAMLAYGLDADQAHALLRRWARNRGLELRELARRLVERAPDGEASDHQRRQTLDALLHDLTQP